MNNSKDRVTDRIYKGYFVPLIISAIGLAASNIVDSLVVGRHMGDAGLAALGLAAPLYMLFAVFYATFGIGGSILCTEEIGNGRKEQAVKRFRIMMELSIIIGLIFTILGFVAIKPVLFLLGTTPADGEIYQYTYQYVRALLITSPVFFINQPMYIFIRNDDDPGLAVAGYFVGNILDVCLCVLFVVGLEWGVQGSIYSTLIGQSVACVIYIFHFISKEHNLSVGLAGLDFNIIKESSVLGFASTSQYISQFLFIMLTNHIVGSKMPGYGVAVFNVVVNVSYIVLIFFNASCDALQPIGATFYGERNANGVKRIRALAVKSGMAGGCVLLAITIIFAKQVALMFGLQNEQAVYMGTVAIRIYCISAAAAGLNMIMAAYYQSIGREKLTYLINTLRCFALLIANMLICSAFANIWFWLFYPLTEVVTFIVMYVLRNKKVFASKVTMPAKDEIMVFEIHNEADLTPMYAGVEEFCEKHDAPIKKSMYISNTVEEVCCSIINNASDEDKDKLTIVVTISVEVGTEDFRLCIRDNALKFNPFDMKTAKISADDDDDDILAGLGIMMVKSKAKDFYYNRMQVFNTMIVVV